MKPEDVRVVVAATLMAQGLDTAFILYLCAGFAAFQAISRRFTCTHKKFDLDSYDDLRAQDDFRFTPSEIRFMARALKIPKVVVTRQRVPIPREEALCIVLRRLSYPCRWRTLASEFGRDPSVLSSAFNRLVTLLHWRVRNKIKFDRLVFERFAERSYACITRKSRRDTHCVGFIDGTIRRICRPTRHQRIVYSGFKKTHCLKYQAVTIANGLIVALHGPVEGRRHDSFLLRDSKIKDIMRQYPRYKLYGDQGYPSEDYLVRPFVSAHITRPQARFNKALSRCRITVEWGFGEIAKYWAFNNYRENLKLYKSPVGSIFIVSAFLTNCLLCAKGDSAASEYFGCDLLSLYEYMVGFDTSEPRVQEPESDGANDHSE